MSCAGHKQEYIAAHPGDKLKVKAVFNSVTIEELGAIMDALHRYRKEHQ